MKALSIKQPWASLIAHGIKDIENRTWRTHFRGKIYIHASGQIFPFFKGKNLAFTPSQWDDINKKVDVHIKEEKEKFFLTSAIIGEVDIIDCVQDHPSIWAEKSMKKPHIDDFTLLDNGIEHTNETDYYHALHVFNNQKPIYNWVLANPVLYEKPILNVKGKLSFWEFVCKHENCTLSDGLTECLDCGLRNY